MPQSEADNTNRSEQKVSKNGNLLTFIESDKLGKQTPTKQKRDPLLFTDTLWRVYICFLFVS